MYTCCWITFHLPPRSPPCPLPSQPPCIPSRVYYAADELYDVERRDSMWWRREGEAFEPPESDSEEEMEAEGAEGPLINARNME